jgi:hypothetical protein
MNTIGNPSDTGNPGRFMRDALLGAGSPALTRRHLHLSAEERIARGKAARQKAPRSSHGEWEPAANRQDPTALLEEQAESRVPELVPIRHGRMLVSPLTFFRSEWVTVQTGL